MRASRDCAVVLSLLLWASLSPAQEVHAVLAGRVTDESGRAVSGATVTARSDRAALAPATAVTDEDGRYRIPLLPPAPGYRIRVAAEGLQTLERGPLSLPPGRTTRIDLTVSPLRDGGGPEKEARDEAPETSVTVDLGHTATDTIFAAGFVDGLPLRGRRYQDVLTLAPGVDDFDSLGDPTVNGARPGSSQVRLDGALNTDPGYGGYGQELNLESLQDLQVLSTGAPAPFGGAQGGFTNAISRSGGNRLSGSLKLFYRSDILDGDGAANVDAGEPLVSFDSFDAVQPFFQIAGPIVPDRLWYSVALGYLSTRTNGVPALGADKIDRSDREWMNFGRISWQVSQDHRLAFEVAGDRLDSDGLGLGPLVSADSAYSYEQRALQGTVRWDWRVGPDLLLETLVSGYRSTLDWGPSTEGAPCPVDAQGRCLVLQQDVYTLDLNNGQITGPYPQTVEQDRDRLSLRSDVTFFLDGPGGRGQVVRAGLEATRESADLGYRQDPIRYEQITAGGFGGLNGTITLFEPLPPMQQANAVSQRVGLYLEDQFRPIPSLSIRLGLRYDVERLEADGYTAFDPAAEAERFLELYRVGRGTRNVDLVDAYRDARVVYDINGDGLDALHCSVYDLDGASFGDGMPDMRVDDFWTYVDGNFDGIVDPDDPADFVLMQPDGLADGSAVNPSCDRASDDTFFLVSTLTRHQFNETGAPFSSLSLLVQGRGAPGTAREAERYEIDQGQVAPRFSIAWDPWKDGRTQFFGTWGRYYGTIPPALLLVEAGPDLQPVTYDAADLISPLPVPEATGSASTYVVDRDLKTPFTDEWTLGFQRGLGQDWLLALVYVNREAEHQLQDYAVNHYTADRDGDGFVDDAIGQVRVSGGFTQVPDGLPDLYLRNAFFNEVYRIGSDDRSEYDSIQLSAERRMRGRWQLIASYVYSRAKGTAEETFSLSGNDVSVADQEFSSLGYDATHAVKLSAVGSLRWGQTLGGILQWHSGLPYDLVERPVALDNLRSTQLRTVYTTGARNSERNEGVWLLDLAYRKMFTAGKVNLGFGIEALNVLNSDDLRVTTVNRDDGFGDDIQRSFGRRWQLSFQLTF